MFNNTYMFRSNYNHLLDEADIYIRAERKQYIDVYDVADKYIADQGLLIGGQLAVNLIHGEDNSDNYFYEIYTSNAFVHATKISNMITSGSPKRIVRMVTIAAYKVYHIFVDTRLIMVLYDVKVHSGTNYLRIVEPITKTLRGKEMLVVSPEIQLLDIYRRLYLPSHADEWEKLLINESKLFSMVISRKEQIQKLTTGARETPIREKIDALMMEYVSSSNKILIGEHACEVLLGVKSAANFIEVLSFSPLEEDIAEIKDKIRNITTERVQTNTRELEIMGDYRLTRTTIKLGTDSPKDIMYIYNSADYDLIPYNVLESPKRTLWVGNPFVILRFLLVNLWIVRRVRELGLIDDKFANMRISAALDLIIELRKRLLPSGALLGSSAEINPELIASGLPLSVFQHNRYAGVFVSEDIAFKIERTQMKERFPDYYPLEYMKKFGKYREI